MSSEKQKKKKEELEGLEAASFRAGEIVEEIIDNAIRSADYSSLSRQVTEALDRAADALHESLTNAARGKSADGSQDRRTADNVHPTGQDMRLPGQRQTGVRI